MLIDWRCFAPACRASCGSDHLGASGQLVASSHFVGEVVTIVRYRVGWLLAHRLGTGLRSGEFARLIRVLPADLDTARLPFSERQEQRLSITDGAAGLRHQG